MLILVPTDKQVAHAHHLISVLKTAIAVTTIDCVRIALTIVELVIESFEPRSVIITNQVKQKIGVCMCLERQIQELNIECEQQRCQAFK